MVFSPYIIDSPVAFRIKVCPPVERAAMVILVSVDIAPVLLKWIFLDLVID